MPYQKFSLNEFNSTALTLGSSQDEHVLSYFQTVLSSNRFTNTVQKEHNRYFPITWSVPFEKAFDIGNFMHHILRFSMFDLLQETAAALSWMATAYQGFHKSLHLINLSWVGGLAGGITGNGHIGNKQRVDLYPFRLAASQATDLRKRH